MAKEITLAASIKLSNLGLKTNPSISGFKVDQATRVLIRDVVTMTTTPVALALGGVVTPGWAFFLNLEDPATSTDIIVVGPSPSSAGALQPFIELEPGEFFVARLAVAPHAKSLTGTPQLDYTILGK